MGERDRYEFLVARDGKDAAIRFLRENVIATYRKCVLDPFRYSLKRRELIAAYAEAKRILREAAV